MPEAKWQKKPRRWKGGLAQKIRPRVIRPRGVAVTNADTAANANAEMDKLFEKAIGAERIKKLHQLMKLWGIEHGNYQSVAIRLAVETGIPGFQVDEDKKEGRRTEWTPERLDELVMAVEKTKKEHGCLTRNREALEHLARRKEWSPSPNHRGNWIKTLENRLAEGKKFKLFTDRQADKWRKLIEELKCENNPEN